MSRKKFKITEEAQNEIDRFKREIAVVDSGVSDETHFKKFRLNNGIYGIRFKSDEHMIRIKLPFGYITADQLDQIADVAEQMTPTQLLHVTTRQAIQLHNIKRSDIPELLTKINEAGLTSREACGNTVRNLTCDELAGIHKNEIFDVNPYTELLFRYLLRNPIGQNLPRKFKIAFEGCSDSDRARLGIHDLGYRAVIQNGKKGFKVTAGGGLGSSPFAAYPLEDFLPVEDYLYAAEAVVRLFDRYGNRRDRNRARLKFLIHEWGIEEFSKRYFEEKAIAKSTGSGKYEIFKFEWQEEKAPDTVAPFSTSKTDQPGFDKWKKSNVVEQKQAGYNAVYVRCLYGDMTPDQARAVSQIARDFGGSRLRSSITQNMIFRWIPNAALPSVFERLSKAGIAERNAESIADITRCPGADTCNLAITHSKGLARDLTEKVFSNGFLDDEAVQHISIKISGCTNSCGQHHIANIGFYGGSRNVDGKQLPHYQMLIGGRTGLTRDDVKFGDRIAMIPARRISEATKHLLNLYKKDKQGEETFIQWSDRVGKVFLVSEMKPFTDAESLRSAGAAMFEDLGDDSGDAFKVAVGKGECAA